MFSLSEELSWLETAKTNKNSIFIDFEHGVLSPKGKFRRDIFERIRKYFSQNEPIVILAEEENFERAYRILKHFQVLIVSKINMGFHELPILISDMPLDVYCVLYSITAKRHIFFCGKDLMRGSK